MVGACHLKIIRAAENQHCAWRCPSTLELMQLVAQACQHRTCGFASNPTGDDMRRAARLSQQTLKSARVRRDFVCWIAAHAFCEAVAEREDGHRDMRDSGASSCAGTGTYKQCTPPKGQWTCGAATHPLVAPL